jgi:hypothetical protein
MATRQLLAACAVSIAFAAGVTAHGGGSGIAHQKPIQVDPDADWATKHMAGKLGSLLKYPEVLTVKRGASYLRIRSSILLFTPRLRQQRFLGTKRNSEDLRNGRSQRQRCATGEEG